MCFLATSLPLLLVSALVFCTEALEDIVSQKIQAIAGEPVILPCTVSVKDGIPSVEWSKEHLYPTIAFLYRDGCETFEEKNQTFQFRTNLFLKELTSGNASLRLSNAQLSDAGTYKCKLIEKGKRPQEVGSIELSVDELKTSCTLKIIIAAVIVPIILCAIVAFRYLTGVMFVRDNNCSLRKQHTEVPRTEDDNAKEQIDELQGRIFDLQYKLNQEIEINSKLKEELKDFKSKQSPVVFHDQHMLVHIPSPDVSKPLKTQSKLPDDDNPTPAASTNNNHQSSVSLPQNKDSKPDVPTHIPAFPQIQRGTHSHSSPALLTINDDVSPSSPSASSSSLVQRSMSMPESGSRSNGAKPQRRKTLPYPCPSANRFSPLANLPEDDSMPLLE